MTEHSRRAFLVRSTAGGMAAAPSTFAFHGGGTAVATKEAASMAVTEFDHLPNFCSHEHWGSIPSIGMSPEGFRADVEAGATPNRRTGIWDLVLDPYLGGWIQAAGDDPNGAARSAGFECFTAWWAAAPGDALKAMRDPLLRQRTTGAFQCIRRGVHFLHGVDLAGLELEAWQAADEAVAAAYAGIFASYRRAMDRAGFDGLVRPVHPEFLFRRADAGDAAEELSFTDTILRIDPLLELWPESCPRRDALADQVGVEPRDAASWEDFLDRLFDLAAEQKVTGIKQLQAYTRPLDFAAVPDGGVTWTGDLEGRALRVWQDWIMHACCKRAHQRGWPHQVHVGTHNLAESGPLSLQGLAQRYPGMKIVMLHCWPFLDECGWLAKHVPNIYIDTCWQCVLNPAYFRQSLDRWLGYVPHHKIMCAHDATSVEMAVGASRFTREILAACLAGHASDVQAPQDLVEIASALLHDNASRVYHAEGVT